MTCFWDSILSSLDSQDFKLLGFIKRPHRNVFILKLKEKNKLINTIWQGNDIKLKEKKEHYNAIKEYDISKIATGHLTSTCDSFLLLLSDILKIKIIHTFLNKNIIYNHPNTIRKTLYFKSNMGHFSKK